MGLTELLKSFQSLNMEQATVKAIEATEGDMIKRNQLQLNIFGMDSKGNTLKPYFDREYATYKYEINPLPGFGIPDLELSGQFYSGFYATVKGTKIEFGSTDSKTGKLTKQYGKNIFGLTTDNVDEYATETLRPKVVEYVEKITGLKAT